MLFICVVLEYYQKGDNRWEEKNEVKKGFFCDITTIDVSSHKNKSKRL